MSKTTKRRFNNLLGEVEGAGPSQAEARSHRQDDYDESDDSMDSFIEEDMDDEDQRGQVKQRRTWKGGRMSQVSRQDKERVDSIFKDYFSDDEEEGGEGDAAEATTAGLHGREFLL